MTDQATAEPEAAEDQYNEILYDVSDRVATITLNMPDKRNRLSYRIRRDIIAALRAAERDDDVTVILIRANGPSFCAGYDLSPSDNPTPPTEKARYYRDDDSRPEGWVSSPHFDDWTDQWARSCVRDWMNIWTLLKPVVAMVHGHCVAGGTELMSMCDIVFVADDARIGYPPMRGMTTPDVPYFPWKMSMAHAKYLQLTGNSVTGAEAARMGWVAKSFPIEDLERETMRELRAISSIPVALLSANKQSVNQAYEIQGMRTHFDQSWSWHQLSGTVRPEADEFARRLQEGGLKAALAWRDGAFQEEGFI
ncbi:enoyl-CoA hydratase-related protein [Nocardioides marmotae]|uniref:enoyl-CoA hydratase-related protein n=1 Tax=Nocardioides marmotae TaxID=2663857 RepID=UPI0012B54A28|nr:enoyl-CoA hydratase-related protein [Nocardioides marmotae]MBC9732339.1 enoyl-CoA hydratase/isomerase family protein [Nocardioides marmotae]MTB83459.1 enoyl-CoA hydratase [Nocardioides marmotae]